MRSPDAPAHADPRNRTFSPPRGGAAELPETFRLDGSTTPPPARPDPHVPRVPGYDLISVVGCGGMGVVFEARHHQLGRRVALKMLRGDVLIDPQSRERFRAEGHALARLQHPNIIQVFEVGTTDPAPGGSPSVPFIALEFVDGGCLVQRTRSPQPPAAAARTVETLARAVHTAHLLGVIHRDLKPANVLLTPAGEPKVADFGIAKLVGDDAPPGPGAMTLSGYVFGTPEYMAPEQFTVGAATPAIDVYSLGVILYQLLTARIPFQGATVADTMRLVLDQEPVPPRSLQPAVPRDLETICLKCLEKEPARRYESAEALADDLSRWAAGHPIRARALGPTGRAARWVRRNPLVAGLSGVLVVVALAGLTGVLWGWGEARRNAVAAEANATAAEASAASAREAERDARTAARNERRERYRVGVMAASGALRLHDTEAARRALDDTPLDDRDWVWNLLRAQLDRSQTVLAGRGNRSRMAWLTPDARWALLQGEDVTFRVWDTVGRVEYDRLDLGPAPVAPVLSPDGVVLAYGVPDHTVRLRELATGRTRAELRGHRDRVHTIDFSDDGRRVVTASHDGTLRVWDAADGRELRQFRAPPDENGALTLSPDGRLVASRGQEGTPAARLWELDTGRERATLGGHGGCAHFVMFSPTGDRVVTAERFPHTNVYVWDAATGRRLAALKGHENQVTSARFSPDGTRLATTSSDRTVRLWDVSEAPAGRETEALHVLRGHAGAVNHAAFSADGSRLVSASHDRTVRYWNARSGELLAVLCGHTDQVITAEFRGDRSALVSAAIDGTVRVWDTAAAEGGGAVAGHENFVYHVAFFPDGGRVASAAWDGTARVWDATTGRELKRFDHGIDRYVTSVAVQADGKYLATTARHEGHDEVTVRVWDVAAGRVRHRWNLPIAWQDGRAAFAPRGDLLAAGCRDGRVKLWDAASGVEAAELPGGGVAVRDLAFSPNGSLLAVGYDDGDCTVRVWDVATRTVVRQLRGHAQGVYALAWNRAGTLLATGSLDRTARLWDAATGACVADLAHGTVVYGVAFSADGRLLACACGDNLVRTWDVASHRETAELSGHRNYVHHLAFSPDGSRLATASGDRTLRIWDTLPRAARDRR